MSALARFVGGGVPVLVVAAGVTRLLATRARRRVRRRLGVPGSLGPLAPGAPGWRPGPVGGVAGRLRSAAGRRHRVEARYRHDLPDALASLARALRAGTPFAMALRAAAEAAPGPVGHDVVAAADELAHGRPLVEVLERWAGRRPFLGVRLSAAALLLGTDVGGSRARAVDRVATRLRDHAAAAREVQALSTQARLSAVVIGAAPLVFAALGLVGDGEVAHVLLATPMGWACLAGGLTLDGAAAWWMRRIVREAAP